MKLDIGITKRDVGRFEMNERIFKLAIEARKYAETKPDIYQVAYDKKFAELIVRECDKYVAERWDICEPWMNPGDLLKHFGVKE